MYFKVWKRHQRNPELRLGVGLFLLAVGVLAGLVAQIGTATETWALPDFAEGFFDGVALGLVALSIVVVASTLRGLASRRPGSQVPG